MNLRFLLIPAVVFGLGWIACGEPLSHVYAGELYDRDADCLYPGTVIDPALEGPPEDAGFCDAICITDLDGGVWVSGQCPPYPETFDLTGTDPACARAFAASCRQCPVEGGGVQTICDAGVSEDAAKEAGNDSGHDSAPNEDAGQDGGTRDARSDATKD